MLGTDFTDATAENGNSDANVATVNELVGIRKENAQKDKKIEKLEAQILKLKDEMKRLK